jgi:hypothetical protein
MTKKIQLKTEWVQCEDYTSEFFKQAIFNSYKLLIEEISHNKTLSSSIG